MSPSRSTTRNRISLASGAGSQRSPIGLIGAIALHLAIIGAMFFTWQHRLDIAQESPPVVPVDLVTIAQKTNIAPAVRPAPKVEPVPQPQTPPPTVQTPPLPKEAEPAPQPVVKPEPAPKPVPEKKTDEEKFDQFMKNFAPSTTQPTKKSTEDKYTKLVNDWASPTGKHSTQSRAPAGAQTAMTADLATYFFNKVRPCWYISGLAGAPNPETLVVQIEVSLNPDGSVASPPQLTAQSMANAATNRYLKATADSAIRAITQCAPFKLPPDRYAEWRQSVVNFSPQEFAN